MQNKKKLVSLWLCTSVLLMLLAACGSNATESSNSLNVGVSTATSGAAISPTATIAATTAPTSSLATVTSAPVATSTPAPTASSVPTPTNTTAPTATNAPAPTATSAPAPQPTPLTGTEVGSISNVVYSTERGLYAYNIATSKSFELAQGNILRYVVSPDNRRAAFLAANGKNVELKLVIMHGNSASDPKTLDSQVGAYTASSEDDPFAGRYMLAFTLAFSPDSNLVAYTKFNANGPSFESWGKQVKSTEVWVADAQAYTVRRVAPNTDKNFAYKVKFSPDNARIAFLKTANFPSDVSGTSALWSVHTDGTVLTILQDGGVLSKQAGTAGANGDPAVGRISEFNWTGPLGIAFSVGGLTGGSAWVHDLSNAKVRQLFSSDYSQNNGYEYDPISRRYAFSTDKGLFTIGTTSAQDKPVFVTNKADKLLNFYENSVTFVNDSNTAIVQSVNDDGSLVGVALGLPALHRPNGEINSATSGYGNWVVTWSFGDNQLNIGIFSGDGNSTVTQPFLGLAQGQLQRLSQELFLVSTPNSLQVLDLTNKPVLKVIYQK